MKSPRVISRKGNNGKDEYFYICYYLPGNKNAVKEPVGEKLDIPTGTGEWWKKSRHKDKIKTALKQATLRKAEYENNGIYQKKESRKKNITLDALLDLYNEEMRIAQAHQSNSTLEKRKYAILKVREFDSYATPQTMNREWAGRFKEYLKGMSPESARTYIASLRALFVFAIEEKLIISEKNPFDRVRIEVQEKEVRHIIRTDQIKVFDQIHKTNPKIFWQIMMMRLSGYRTNEVCNMKSVSPDYLQAPVKMRRIDKYPVTACIKIILRNAIGRHGYIFWNRDRSTSTHSLNDACRAIGIPIFGSHQLKRDYMEELEPFVRGNPYIKNLMAHHIPKGMTATADKHYIGSNLKLMEEVADNAQRFWLEYLQGYKQGYETKGQ